MNLLEVTKDRVNLEKINEAIYLYLSALKSKNVEFIFLM